MPTNPQNRTRSTSEVGHAKNVAQFQKMITKCELLSEFNPPNPIIYMVELKKFYTKSNNAIRTVHEKNSAADIAINERQIEFRKLDFVAPRTVNILAVIANEPKIVADARTILRRIQGAPSKPKTNENQPGQEVLKPRSNSQQSYDKLIDHFVALIELIKQVNSYAPNETELTIASLEALLADLVMRNKKVISSNAELSKVRKQRNETLYHPVDGLINRAKLVKLYVKSLYGTSSTEYKEINAIRFRNEE